MILKSAALRILKLSLDLLVAKLVLSTSSAAAADSPQLLPKGVAI